MTALVLWIVLATVLGALAIASARKDRAERQRRMLHSLGVAKGHRRATRFE